MNSYEYIVKGVLKIMSTIGNRLEEERKRLGFNQSDFGELGGVKRQAQGNYESDDRRPDADYLAAIAKAGADITYIVSGTKSGVNYEKELVDLESLEIAIECIELYIDELDLKVSPAKKAKVIRMLYPLIRDDDENEVPDNVIDLLKLAAEVEEKGDNNEQQKETVATGSEGTS